MSANNRYFRRESVEVPCTLRLENNVTFSGKIVDLSLSGCCIQLLQAQQLPVPEEPVVIEELNRMRRRYKGVVRFSRPGDSVAFVGIKFTFDNQVPEERRQATL